ncbi:thiopeptide-type bacteriocin biosynthesis protein [Streptomyces atroolivaceus]|uniref:thiopeptide-type bacteriocin biosynthesis protein n=1 Tax=Streptomyces atroolivaceus TaxID=66869 RepID=UPI0036284432
MALHRYLPAVARHGRAGGAHGFAGDDGHDDLSRIALARLVLEPHAVEGGHDLIADLAAENLMDRWFYIRYADPFPHLRLRVRGTELARTLTRVTEWGRSLVDLGLARDIELAGYAPEIARYGGPDVFDAVEQLFRANSEATARLLSRRLDLRPEFLGVATLDTLHAQWGVDLTPYAEHGADPDGAHVRDTRALFRAHRDYLCELLSPWDRQPHEEGRAHRLLFQETFAAQAPAVAQTAEAVRAAAREGVLVGCEDQVLASLAHMQINRLLPIDLDREGRSHALWAHVRRAVRGREAAVGAPPGVAGPSGLGEERR